LPPDARVELIAGEIVDMAPIGSRHAGTVERLARTLHRQADAFSVRAQQPVALGEDSEPVPDIALVRPRADDYLDRHPAAADVFLIIEVSDASLHYDLDVKLPLYARHGIPEVWVVDPVHRQVVRCAQLRGSVYGTRETVDGNAVIATAALPGARVDFSEVFAS
jgi:Uma2 family endonuclease